MTITDGIYITSNELASNKYQYLKTVKCHNKQSLKPEKNPKNFRCTSIIISVPIFNGLYDSINDEPLSGPLKM